MDELIRKRDALDALERNACNTQRAFEAIKVLPPAEQTERSIGKFVVYTGEPCPNCGRLRVERYESGLEICEKCNWCEQTKSYWLDGV